MKVLQKTLLSQVAGGEADEVVFAYGGGDAGGGWGGDYGGYDGGGYDGGYDSGWDGGGSDWGSSGGSAGFDNNGVGMTSCVAMPPPPAPLASGLFGYSMAETVTLAGGLGGGVGASLAIESAGGWSAIGSLGTAAPALVAATGAGIAAAAITGWAAGSALYNHSETVQEWSQKAWGGVFQVIESATQSAAEMLHSDRHPHPVYHP